MYARGSHVQLGGDRQMHRSKTGVVIAVEGMSHIVKWDRAGGISPVKAEHLEPCTKGPRGRQRADEDEFGMVDFLGGDW